MSAYARSFQQGERQSYADRRRGCHRPLTLPSFPTEEARGFFDGYMPRSAGWHTTPKPLPTAPQYLETT